MQFTFQTNNNNRELIERFQNLKALYNLKEKYTEYRIQNTEILLSMNNIEICLTTAQCTNTHNYTNQ